MEEALVIEKDPIIILRLKLLSYSSTVGSEYYEKG
jgi:hypothetical protein